MKIVSIGGGPAGLYFGILRKKAHPSDDITIVERNLPYQTFGWGVVFSDETLGYLEANDPETHKAITERFAHWSAIDIHAKGEVIRSGGHGFSGIARKDLLNILQHRCEELGVKLVFEREISDVTPYMRENDLVLVADGVKSAVRTQLAEVFAPSVDVRKCKYIWLGTSKRFDAFTFIFEENAHGIFQVHGYPFDATQSTFIVECDEASWRAAGFDAKTTDESVAYLEQLFAATLDGHKLLTNKSAWVSFPTIRNQRWHHENVVLLGDAAHTAHFSIGSGTKLAMEDSIALVRALEENPRLDEALQAYESTRKPEVERMQKAAQDSLVFFENIKRYWVSQGAMEFAFNLLTRSKRITYDNLKLRDPELVARVTREFASRAGATAPVSSVDDSARPPMFTPFHLRGMTLVNRIIVSPMCMYSADDGTPGDFHLVHLGARAMGGAGLVYTEMTDVSHDARITKGCAGMYAPEHVVAWKRIVDFVHASSHAKICLQLGHAGRKGATRLMWEGMDQPLDAKDGPWPLLSASAIPYYPHSQVPKAMDAADMKRVRRDFVHAAEMAITAGFDMLEIHAAHGYLLASFLSPLTNLRTDEYGGSLQNRMRYPLSVFDAVRAVWPQASPMSVRISATDWAPGGLPEDEAVEVARLLRAHGCDLVDVSTGQTTADAKPVYGRMWQTPFSDHIRHVAGVATVAVGNIASGDQVNTILAAGRADLCALARPHLDDPHFTLHAAKEQGVEVAYPNPYVAVKPILKPFITTAKAVS